MVVLVTGAAGFIGFHLCLKLLKEGYVVLGIDNLNDYYDVSLKNARLEILRSQSSINHKSSFTFHKINIEDKEKLKEIFETYKPSKVVNLAAQAGVRYSLINPSSYYQSNLIGFGNIIQCCADYKVNHLLYASSSSVYGGNINLPLSEKDQVNHPVSLYAATKRANELIAHSYSHIHGLPSTGLRFFTVYGPWGRPDMALFLFTKAMLEGKKIDIYNGGEMVRDFTYIDDVVISIFKLLDKPPESNDEIDRNNLTAERSWAPHRIFNVGNSNPVKLLDFVQSLENLLCLKADLNFLPMQKGDVAKTQSDSKLLEEFIDFKPRTNINVGIKNFVDWYKEFYKIDYN